MTINELHEQAGDWDDLPRLLTVAEAMRVLRIGRSKVYEMTAQYLASGGIDGLPVLKLNGALRVPRFALVELITTGRVVQLHISSQPIRPPSPVVITATPARSGVDRTARSTAASQISLLPTD
jgi:hypothetical protein